MYRFSRFLRPFSRVSLVIWIFTCGIGAALAPLKAAPAENKPPAEQENAKKAADSKEKPANSDTDTSIGHDVFGDDWLKKRRNPDQEDLADFENRFRVFGAKQPLTFHWAFQMLNEYHYSNNGDLRKLDAESDQAILYTDDRMGLGLTRAKFDALIGIPKQNTGAELSFGLDGMWGHDQLQGYSNPGTRINRANVFWEILDNGSASLLLITGRQYFSVGGIPHDYMQKDVLDAVVLQAKMAKLLDVKLLAFDAFSGAANTSGATTQSWNDEFKFMARDTAAIQPGINGDVSTYRWGMVVSMAEMLGGNIDPRVYSYYARPRGVEGGNDRSENGKIGNFSDNDWSSLTGARLGWTVFRDLFDYFTFYADAAFSRGQDRKKQGQPDADNNGLGMGTGLTFKLKGDKISPLLDLDGFYAGGPQYNKNGDLVSHGFVSFKGDEVGGLLMSRYWGVHPSAYTDDDGIDDTPYDKNRKSGLAFFHVGGGAELYQRLTARVDYWHLFDTGASAVNFARISKIKNQFLTQAQLRAQKKLGKTIGQEVNIALNFKANEVLNFYWGGGIFLPSDFFRTAIDESVSANGAPKGARSDADFTGMVFGGELKF